MAQHANIKDVSETEFGRERSERSQTNVSATESNEGEEAACGEPPAKKSKTPSTSGKAGSKGEKDGKDPYPYARIRGIRIFSEREISSQDAEMTREYWNFWNRTAEELCSDRAYNDWGKRDLKLYIDAAWVVHKTNLQETHERQLQEAIKELQERYGHGELPVKLKTEDENVTELLAQVRRGYYCTGILLYGGFGRRVISFRMGVAITWAMIEIHG